MACPCTSYIRLAVDLCDDPLVLTQVVADETGTWTAQIEFNGQAKCELTFDVVAGQPVPLPNVLNEVYTHEMRIFRSDGSLVGCYWIGGPSLSQFRVCGGGRIIAETGELIISEAGAQLIPETVEINVLSAHQIFSELTQPILSESGAFHVVTE